MNKTYEVYLISDSTGETLDRIFLALQAQFLNFKHTSHQYAFTRTENKNCKPFPNTDVQDRHKGPRMPAALPYLLTWHIRLRPLQAC